MKSPKLWWPHTHHDGPNLYTLRLELFKINVYMPHAGQDGRLNSSLMGAMKQEDIKFGVRTFSTYIDREVTMEEYSFAMVNRFSCREGTGLAQISFCGIPRQ